MKVESIPRKMRRKGMKKETLLESRGKGNLFYGAIILLKSPYLPDLKGFRAPNQ